MKYRDPYNTDWVTILTVVALWVGGLIFLGFVVKMNWRLFMIGWNLWP